uniref:EBNA-1 n=1 Tax=Arthrobacter sp. J3.40 TaxID=347209 RepID=I3W0Z4_9MICC|nr:EBNA-1 [Arthrobacter sp. J3.40]
MNTAVDSGANSLGEAMMGAWDSIMKGFLTSWLDAGMMVSLEGESMAWLTDQLQILSIFMSTLGIMIACVWTMVHARGDKAVKAAKSLFMVFLVTTAGTTLMQVAIPAGDAFSKYILDEAGVTVQGYEQLGPAAAAVGQIGPGLAIVAGIFGVIATLLQWVIMIVRATVLPLLVAIWPVAAAAAMIRGAEQSFSKVTMWLVAFLLYKPIAAIIYAFAWKLKSGGDGIGGVINGMLLLVLAVVALPALMKLLSPATAAMGSAAGGTMALGAGAAVVTAGVAAGAAVATGGASAGARGAAGFAGTAGPSGGASTAQGTTSMAALESSSGTAPGGAPAGPSGSAASSNPGGSVAPGGTAGSNGGTGSGGASTGGSSAGGAVAKGASGGTAGLQAATQSMGGSIAQGAQNTDGKDVLGS